MSKQKIIELKDLFQSQLDNAQKLEKKAEGLGKDADEMYYMGSADAFEYAINKLEEYLESN